MQRVESRNGSYLQGEHGFDTWVMEKENRSLSKSRRTK
jgi:hypothetical protein